jgi:hypothetical protein
VTVADRPPTPGRLRDLVDAYLDGALDAAGLAELEALLLADAGARADFALYAQAHTDLAFEVAARAAAERALAGVPAPPVVPEHAALQRAAGRPPRSAGWLVAASLLVGLCVGGGVVGLLAAPAPQPRPAPAPRTLTLDFRAARPGSLADAAGGGTGFTHRLPGTGAGLPADDPHLRLVPGGLEVTATGSDLNTRFRLDRAEFPGVRLADLGFTGGEDFEVTAAVADAPAMAFVGQFGVYAGTSAEWAVRGGLVSQRAADSYRQFVANTRDGRDKDAHFVGLGAPGDDLRLRLARVGGRFSVAVENRTSGATSTLATRHPEFLDGRADLVVGVFACDPRGADHKAVRFGGVTATVWVQPPAR